MASLVRQFYTPSEKRIPFYFYSSNNALNDDYFRTYGIGIVNTNDVILFLQEIEKNVIFRLSNE